LANVLGPRAVIDVQQRGTDKDGSKALLASTARLLVPVKNRAEILHDYQLIMGYAGFRPWHHDFYPPNVGGSIPDLAPHEALWNAVKSCERLSHG